jgi:hypothetical protein
MLQDGFDGTDTHVVFFAELLHAGTRDDQPFAADLFNHLRGESTFVLRCQLDIHLIAVSR